MSNGQWLIWRSCRSLKRFINYKNQTIEGTIPVIAGGQEPAYFHNKANRSGEVITVSASGAYAGFVNYFEIPIFASDCSTIQSKNQNQVKTKYLFYILKSKQEDIYKFQQGGGQPHVYPKDLVNIQILPPLEVQQEIVSQLDSYQKIIDGAKQVVDNYKPEIKIDPDWEMVELGKITELINGDRGTNYPSAKAPCGYWYSVRQRRTHCGWRCFA